MKRFIFNDPDKIVYADINQFSENFGKECGIEDLRGKIETFRANPVPEGVNLKGTKRTAIKLVIPNLYFKHFDKTFSDADEIEMGDTVWVYMGELYEVYCLYWPQ